MSRGLLYEALAATTDCEAAYRQSGNPRLLIEFALLKISRINIAPAVAQPTATVQAVQPTVAQPVAAQVSSTAQPATSQTAPRQLKT